jgi:hypothetical protein
MNKDNALMLLIHDREYFEGFVGAFGTILSFYVFRQLFDVDDNLGILLGLTFITTWLIRKMGMNIYTHMKSELNIDDHDLYVKEIDYLEKYNDKKQYYIFTSLFFLIVGIMATLTANKALSTINISIYLLYVVGFFSLIHFSS